MADLHLLGLPRTGSSFAHYYFTGILRGAGVDFIDLFEISNPWLKLIPKPVGYSVAGFEAPTGTTHDDRVRMYESYSSTHRLVKHCFTPPCDQLMEYMLCPGAKCIEIKRDRFERYLSWVIARKTNVWVPTSQHKIDNIKRTLEPFHSPVDELMKELESNRLYDDFKARVMGRTECIGTIDYDSLYADCEALSVTVLEHFGMPAHDTRIASLAELEMVKNLLPKKSMTLDEKKAIVINWRELQQILEYAA